jgi:hypothetical protein
MTQTISQYCNQVSLLVKMEISGREKEDTHLAQLAKWQNKG